MNWLKQFGEAVHEKTVQAFASWHIRMAQGVNYVKSMFLEMFTHRFQSIPRKSAGEWAKALNTAPWVFAAVRPIADTISGSDLVFYDRDKELPPTHPIPASFHGNSFFTQHDLIYLAVLWFFAPGEFFWLLERKKNGDPLMWWPLPPHWVRERPSLQRPYFRVQFQGYGFGGATWDIPAEEILWAKNCDPFDPYGPGSGRVESASDEVQIYEYASKYNANFFLNSARPDVVLEYPADKVFDEEKVEKVRQKWEERYGGFWKSFKPAVLHSGMKVHSLDTTRKDMDFVEGMRYSADTISAVIGTPKSIMGLIADSNRANSEAAEYIFAKYTVFPIYDAIERAINLKLKLTYGGNIEARFKRPPLRDKDYEHKEALDSLNAGAITVQQYHELHGWEAPPNTDYFLVPSTSIPVKAFAEMPKPTAPTKPEQKAFPVVTKMSVTEFVAAVLGELSAWQEEAAQRGEPFIKDAVLSGGADAILEAGFGIAFNVTAPEVVDFILARVNRIKTPDESFATTTWQALKETLAEGYKAGDSLGTMMDRVVAEFDDARGYRSELIARTEMTGAYNGGALEGYVQAGVEKKAWLAALDERTRDTHVHAHGHYHDYPIPIKQNFNVGAGSGPAPGLIGLASEDCNCFIDGQTPVFTVDGWKPIKSIKKGDLVLSHAGKFRKVRSTLQEEKPGINYSGDVIRMHFRYKGTKSSSNYLTVTPEHPVLIDGEWKRADEICEGDFIEIVGTNCKQCGEWMPLIYNQKSLAFCSHSCSSRYNAINQWKNESHRRNMSRKASEQLKREYEDGTRDRATIVQKAHEAMRRLIELGLDPLTKFRKSGKHTWYKLSGEDRKQALAKLQEGGRRALAEERYSVSSIERKLDVEMRRRGIQFDSQVRILDYVADFVVQDHRIIVECDGDYWHNREDVKKKDFIRDKRLEAYGYTVLRFKEHQINSNVSKCVNTLELLLMNHNGQFQFKGVAVQKVERSTLIKAKRLYNISVEEDESFIAKGVAVHNCRCTLLPVLDEKKMPYGSPEHIERWDTFCKALNLHEKPYKADLIKMWNEREKAILKRLEAEA